MRLDQIAAVRDDRISPYELKGCDRDLLSDRYGPDGHSRPALSRRTCPETSPARSIPVALTETESPDVFVHPLFAHHEPYLYGTDVGRLLYDLPEAEHTVPVGVFDSSAAHLDRPGTAIELHVGLDYGLFEGGGTTII